MKMRAGREQAAPYIIGGSKTKASRHLLTAQTTFARACVVQDARPSVILKVIEGRVYPRVHFQLKEGVTL